VKAELLLPLHRRDALLKGGEALLDVAGGIASKHALSGKQLSELIEALVAPVEPLVGASPKLAELLTVVGELLAKLAEQARGVTLWSGHLSGPRSMGRG